MHRLLFSIVCIQLVIGTTFAKNDSTKVDSIKSAKQYSDFEKIIIAPYKVGKFIKNQADATISRKFNNVDTTYITPNLFNYTFMLENTNTYEYVKVYSRETNQSISFSPKPTYKIGAYFGWRWLFLGWTFDMAALNGKKSSKTDFEFSIYTSKIGVDLFYRKTGQDFKIKNTYGIFPNEKKTDYSSFDGLDIQMKGINLYYIFNHKHFSYPAAFSQSTVQRKSCGSWKIGLAYSLHDLRFDESKLPEDIKEQLYKSGGESMFFNRVKYHDYSISVGYAYNWVFSRNWLLGASFSPALAYKYSKINKYKETPLSIKNLNLDFITRAAIVWNNTKYFAGASLIINNYDYRKDDFSLTNGFGLINIYCGFNFKERKKK